MDCHSEEQDIDGSWQLPAWMTHGRTVLCQKDPRKGNAVENYRLIKWLPLLWELLTEMITEVMYDYLEREKLLPEEQKGWGRGSRGTKDQLLMDDYVEQLQKALQFIYGLDRL